MRILFITDVSLFMRGGVPAEARLLLAGLSARGHSVALASNASPELAAQFAHFPISLPLRDVLVAEIGVALRTFKPNFVHVLSMSSRGVAQLAPMLREWPWALTIHSLPPHERKLGLWHGSEAIHYGARALRFFANSTAWRFVLRRHVPPLVIVHSHYVEQIVVDYGYTAAKVQTIPLPFVAETSERLKRCGSIQPTTPLIVSVGGYAHTKGQHDLVKALPTLCCRFPQLRCQFIGEVRDYSYLRYLEALARKLKVSDHIAITPDLTEAAKLAALEAADVYVQPSHEEGFCLAFAEAAAVVPRLVGTNTGAIAAISADDVAARVVAVRDPLAICAAVEDLLEKDLPIDLMSQRAARLSERFSEIGYLRSHENLYAANSKDSI